MTTRSLMIERTRCGWAVYLSGGTQLVRFHGIGARRRALRFAIRFAERRQ